MDNVSFAPTQPLPMQSQYIRLRVTALRIDRPLPIAYCQTAPYVVGHPKGERLNVSFAPTQAECLIASALCAPPRRLSNHDFVMRSG